MGNWWIITGAKVAECFRAREEFPTAIKNVTDAEDMVEETIAQFQDVLGTLNRVC